VFLLRDCARLWAQYRAAGGEGVGILANRAFLSPSDESLYLEMNAQLYSAALDSNNFAIFRERIIDRFISIIDKNAQLSIKAAAISDYIFDHIKSKRIIFVDMGFQATFALFCQACLRRSGRSRIETDFRLLGVYPWLRNLYVGRYFASEDFAVLALEREGQETFERELSDKAAGAMVGFAIGDALGFPLAGVNRADADAFVEHGQIRNFTAAPLHPHLSSLEAGQFTSNTVLMKLMAESLHKHGGFVEAAFRAELIGYAADRSLQPHETRWLGPTNAAALRELARGERRATDPSTRSCAAAYRSIPIGLKYRPLVATRDGTTLVQAAGNAARLTHNSAISAAGAIMVAQIIADLVHGVAPETAVNAALQALPKIAEVEPLETAARCAVTLSHSATTEQARARLGTGSPIDQALPLALFYFLRAPTDFEKTTLSAANSLRDDTPEEAHQLAKFSVSDAMIHAKGGNTDGIAGLSGAFIGAHIGLKAIPTHLAGVEDAHRLASLGRALVR